MHAGERLPVPIVGEHDAGFRPHQLERNGLVVAVDRSDPGVLGVGLDTGTVENVLKARPGPEGGADQGPATGLETQASVTN